MGYIELSDAGYSRRMHVPELDGTIRIELKSGDDHRLVVPEGMLVDRVPEADRP